MDEFAVATYAWNVQHSIDWKNVSFINYDLHDLPGKIREDIYIRICMYGLDEQRRGFPDLTLVDPLLFLLYTGIVHSLAILLGNYVGTHSCTSSFRTSIV